MVDIRVDAQCFSPFVALLCYVCHSDQQICVLACVLGRPAVAGGLHA